MAAYGTFSTTAPATRIEDVDENVAKDAPKAAKSTKLYEKDCYFVSRLFFNHIRFLFAIQKTRKFTLNDLWQLDEHSTSRVVMARLLRLFEANDGNLLVSILKMEFRSLVMSGWLVLLAIPFKLAPAILTYMVLHRLQGDAVKVAQVVGFLAAMHFAKVLSTLLEGHAISLMSRSAGRVVGGCHSLVFQATILTASDIEIGSITNIYSGGVESVSRWLCHFHGIWSSLLALGAEVYVLSRVVGIDWHLIAIAFGIIGAVFLGTVIFKTRIKSNSDYQRNTRWKAVNECFRAIQCVKLNAWEEKFLKRLQTAREIERKSVLRYAMMSSFTNGVTWCTDDVIIGLVFVYLVIHGLPFNPAVAFSSLIVVQLINSSFTGLLSSFDLLITGITATKSLEKFFIAASESNHDLKKNDNCNNSNCRELSQVVSTHGASFRFDKTTSEYLLVNVNLAVKRGELVVVDGKAGQGKTTLLRAILGQVPCLQGDIFVSDECRVAYCSQEPWVQSLTIRENILFGSPYDEAKYLAVLDACALIDDLRRLPRGDETLVGSRGINLSGGQKARIALARACYADADLYVLDCPLASVDAVVQMDVFRKCIVELLRYKTVVMATHNVEFINSLMVDQLWEVRDQSVTVSGDGRRGVDDNGLSRRVEAYESTRRKSALSNRKKREGLVYEPRHIVDNVRGSASGGQSMETSNSESFIARSNECVGIVDSFRLLFPSTRNGVRFVAVAGVFVAVFELCSIVKNFWLAWWSSQIGLQASSSLGYVLVYESFAVGACVALSLSEAFVSYSISGAVNEVFGDMVRAFLYAPLSFYYRIPIGEVLGRFVTDMDTCDYAVAVSVASLFRSVVVVIGALGVSSYLLGIVGIVIAIVVVVLSLKRTALDVFVQAQLLGIEVESEDVGVLSEALEGISVIHAFGKRTVTRFVTSHARCIDDVHRLRLTWLSLINSEILRTSYLHGILMGALAGVLISSEGTPARLGLSIVYIMKLYSDALSLLSCWALMLVVSKSFEVLASFRSIPPEQQRESDTCGVSKIINWISNGKIVFDHVWFRYAKASYALQDVSFAVDAGARIGVVGRTGSGKSSLAMALFRVHELVRGRILVDGIDIRSLPLRVLRSHMSIILQSPMFYRCTVREYLDPFDEFSDSDLWQVIHKTGLSPHVQTLQTELHENGENWSLGQRQLLCLARSLLRPSKIVILDEPFSSIDGDSDKQLLSVLSSELRESTVLFVTHRLDQVLTFCEKILVLKDGEVEDFGVVEELVGRSDGVFFELLENTLLSM